MIITQIERPNREEVVDLIAKLDNYLVSLYPPECNHLLDIQSLMQPNIVFITAKCGLDYVGCGAIRIVKGEYAEIKRMFVLPGLRGRGVGYRILCELQKIAVDLGFNTLSLETGIKQPEAIKLYERFGFYKISAFGEYRPTGLDVFYEKRIIDRIAPTS
jgi:putative acetyltransferase